MSTPSQLLVTGASGQLGRLVLHHLLETLKVPARQLIATSRTPAKLNDFAQQGVTIRAADFSQPDSLATAFAGAERMLLISTDAIFDTGVRLAQHQRAVEAAEKAKVKHILYTSLPEADSSAITFAPDHLETEKTIKDSNIEGYSILRNGMYFENLLMSMSSVLASGQWFSAAGAGQSRGLSRSDLAKAAASALVNDQGKNTYTLMGQEGITNLQFARKLSSALDKPIQLIEVSKEQLIEGMLAHKLPQAMAETYASFDEETARGSLGIKSDDFTKLTGAQAQNFDSWLDENLDSFRALLS